MPSPRKGGVTPVRRRRFKPLAGSRPHRVPSPPTPLQPGQIISRGHRQPPPSSVDSDSSWVDTTDTSLATSGDSSCSPRSSSASSSTSSCSTGPRSSPRSCRSQPSSSLDSGETPEESHSSDDGDVDGDDDDDDGDDDDDDDNDRRPARLLHGSRMRAMPGEDQDKRGRSWSRRGARDRCVSVLCRYCGKRGYGVMKMVLTCCAKAAAVAAPGAHGVSNDSSSSSTPESDGIFAVSLSPPSRGDDQAMSLPERSLTPRYKWSPCSSDSSLSSSTLSEDAADGNASSVEESDSECKLICGVPESSSSTLTAPPPLQLLHCGSQVTSMTLSKVDDSSRTDNINNGLCLEYMQAC